MRSRARFLCILGVPLLITAVTLKSSLLEANLRGEQAVCNEQSSPEQQGRGEADQRANRLIREKSPYLLQHAHNPVDWYPWGEEAFQKALSENKPIFLSIGYSTCHWCHVMERESFSNAAIATILNTSFISIKVDREERPDVDRVYMTFVQATTGTGGWPLSVFLTPQLEPFFGGTYFPPQERDSRRGFKELLLKISQEWRTNRSVILANASKITAVLRKLVKMEGEGKLELGQDLLARTYQWYVQTYDRKDGGFGRAPKFPRPVNFNFLLRYYADYGAKGALEMVRTTLENMALGGIHDHLGGGFHRYSTDSVWHLPHFEKMLYDQAQLATSYLEAYQITGESLFAQVAGDTLSYVLRDMTTDSGGFCSAEDADSSVSHEHLEEHVEGAFYVWTEEEVKNALGAHEATLFNYHYAVRKEGNVTHDPFKEFTNKNILHVSSTLNQTAEKFGKTVNEVEKILRFARQKLFSLRGQRPRPSQDDKILTAWNGLMISAFAKGYQVLQRKDYLRAAERAAAFVLDNLYDAPSRRLKRRYRLGESVIDGFLSDYAFFIQALLDLYETTLEGRWLTQALDLTEIQNDLFWDQDRGGFFNTSAEDSSILLRSKEDHDGAEPSPNSIATLNLLRISQMANNNEWRELAEKSIRAFEKRLLETPQAMPQMVVALNYYLKNRNKFSLPAIAIQKIPKPSFVKFISVFFPIRLFFSLTKVRQRSGWARA